MSIESIHWNQLMDFFIERGFVDAGKFERLQEHYFEPSEENGFRKIMVIDDQPPEGILVSMKVTRLHFQTPTGDLSLTVDHCSVGDWTHCSVTTQGDFSTIPILPCRERFPAWLEIHRPDVFSRMEDHDAVFPTPLSPISFHDYYAMVFELDTVYWKRRGVDVSHTLYEQPPCLLPPLGDDDDDDDDNGWWYG